MTVNCSFDLEDDDFLDDTFRSIPENDLLSYSISNSASENRLNNNELRDFQVPGTSDGSKYTNINPINTDCNTMKSLSSLIKNRETVPSKEKDVNFSEMYSPNRSVNIDENAKINSRFVPGFTPKAKKRKLPGPAGFFSENDDQHFQPVDSEHFVTKCTTADIDVQNITNSQFSSEDLLLPSWQNLQAEVSSCHNLLSTAKYYSIRRVLHETSKKRLPKHLVVPVLCVLIKKFNAEESSLVLMDDTGEMSGKIDKEVLDMYKDAIHERTALILKKVTCICNILILKKQNVVSVYLDDGSVKHVQDLNSILDKEEPLKPMNCHCPGTPNEKTIKKQLFSQSCNSASISLKKALNDNHKMSKKVAPTSCTIAKSLKENNCNIKNTKTSLSTQMPIGKEKVLNILEAMLDVAKSDNSSGNITSTSSSNQHTGKFSISKSISNVACNFSNSNSTEIMKHNLTSKTLSNKKDFCNNSEPKQTFNTINNPSVAESYLEEELFCEDTDDFDDILCSLDEKSFIQEI
ncbi:uncharacterized protein LOC129961519 [Argiope bruennichi]|uniref:Homologous recombination OB-fold protein like n=1 Tax=Argiope bruennichi TaxID=94029 RepID=A0A8T0FWX9_ARGBR|nr:uncharacterized protein LOC129961519 [Argiope bruennichi]KAF8794080.1 Homologous recombination OB-fold protein like [Argiope bruennichi]